MILSVGQQEDGITISSEGKLIEFYQSEIQSIEKVCEETVKTEEYILMDDGGNGSIEGYTTEMNAASENYLKELANMGNEQFVSVLHICCFIGYY